MLVQVLRLLPGKTHSAIGLGSGERPRGGKGSERFPYRLDTHPAVVYRESNHGRNDGTLDRGHVAYVGGWPPPIAPRLASGKIF